MDAPSGGFKPQLKKIKRPINRQAPQTSARPSGSENVSPFASYVPMSGRKPEVDINDYLDEKPLPSKEVHDIPESADHPQYIDEEAYEEEVYGRRSTAKVPDWLTMKVFFLIISVSLFVGIVAGRFIFAESKIVRNGLQGVVVKTADNNCYLKTNAGTVKLYHDLSNIEYGDLLEVEIEPLELYENTNDNAFCEKDYLYGQKIFHKTA